MPNNFVNRVRNILIYLNVVEAIVFSRIPTMRAVAPTSSIL